MTRLILIAGLLAFVILFTRCSSTSVRINTTERADELSHAPEWAKVTKPMFEADGKRYFLGYVEVDGDASKSAALNMSDEKAMSEPMKALVDEFLDQNQVGEGLMSTTGQRIISSTRGFRPPMPGLQVSKRYWETVEIKTDQFSPARTVLRAYSLVEINLGELEKAKQAYFMRLRGDNEVKAILKEVGNKQIERVLGSEGE